MSEVGLGAELLGGAGLLDCDGAGFVFAPAGPAPGPTPAQDWVALAESVPETAPGLAAGVDV
ncbi:MAG TPA: hypothetical protein VEH47_05030 [Candidatus Acidoferrales bacterium]|nr:hypothetical protein [Candidatus Acidoferrales bacterium]